MAHLRKLGDEVDMNSGNSDVAMKWQFRTTKDNGAATEECPCGKQRIRYLMFIRHKNTRNTTFVGSGCIKMFEERLQNMMKVAHALIVRGVRGTFLGLTDEVEGSPTKLEFKISAHHGLVQNIDDFRECFNPFPVAHLDNKWICQVFPPGRESVYDYIEQLNIEQQYNLKLELSRSDQDDQTGISLYITECEELPN